MYRKKESGCPESNSNQPDCVIQTGPYPLSRILHASFRIHQISRRLDILCRWGALTEIVLDNGAPYVKALDYLAKRYHIHHIRISGYNSCANGIVERSHFEVRQALFKAADGDQSRWHQAAYSVFWADRITTHKQMGCSPYFSVTGTQPFDIVEATIFFPLRPLFYILLTSLLVAQPPFKSDKNILPCLIPWFSRHAASQKSNSNPITTPLSATSISSAGH
jgi:hypothetical protein